MSTFVLKIQLGNEAMQTREDIAWALERASRMVRHEHTHICDGAKIRDDNGNIVGSYKIE
jgi:hypothetical protein